MSRSHRRPRGPRFPDGSPSWYRRALNRLYRSRTAQLVRTLAFDALGPPRRDAGWYW